MPMVAPNEGARRGVLVLLWIYFWLLILEGALRKWVLPQFTDYLLLIRDPLVLLIYLQASRGGFMGETSRYTIFIFTGITLVCQALYHSTMGVHPIVTLYGVRTYLLHVPLIFIMPQIVRQSDIVKFGKWLLFASLPMAVLMGAQYLSPSSSFLNAATIEGGAQITAVGDIIRPAGTFSFTTGVSCFYRTVFAFCLFGLMIKTPQLPRWLVLLSMMSIAAAAMVSGSRTFIMSSLIVVAFALPMLTYFPRLVPKFILFALVGLLGFVIMYSMPTTRAGLETLVERWTGAAEIEKEGYVTGNWMGRVFAGPVEAVYWVENAPALGFGLGLGTNVGGKIMSGSAAMIAPEWEWPRMIFEAGPLIGGFLIALRLFAAVVFLYYGWEGLRKGKFLGWLLLATVIFDITQGQLKQPTNLGFLCFFSGLAWAAMVTGMKNTKLTQNQNLYLRNKIRSERELTP